MTGAVLAFYEFMGSYADFMDEMVASEDEKYRSLISGDLARTDKAIADMQAFIMRIDKLESQREALQDKAGWSGLAFKEIIDKLSGGDRTAFMKLFDRMSRAVALIKHTNKKSMSYADLSLYINGLLPGDASVDSTYNSDGEKKAKSAGEQPGSMFETKI